MNPAPAPLTILPPSCKLKLYIVFFSPLLKKQAAAPPRAGRLFSFFPYRRSRLIPSVIRATSSRVFIRTICSL